MRTRIVLGLAAAIALTISAAAQTEIWQLDPPHCAAQFAVRHMGDFYRARYLYRAERDASV